MPTEDLIPTWMLLDWNDGIIRERLLELRIQQLERLPEDHRSALEKLEASRLSNKERFDRTHRLRSKPIEVGDWVLVFDSILEHQHSTLRKFARRWFGPYVVVTVHKNATYSLRELDGTILRIPIARKRIKAFRRRATGFVLENDINDPKLSEDEDEGDEILDNDGFEENEEDQG